MKWDVKHDRAKEVIDYFLKKAENWQESEDLVAGLTGEEKELVNAEAELMIASIRKRYKLQEHLPEQKVEVKEEEHLAEKAVEKPEEEPVKKSRASKPKPESAKEEKTMPRRTRTKKTEKKEV